MTLLRVRILILALAGSRSYSRTLDCLPTTFRARSNKYMKACDRLLSRLQCCLQVPGRLCFLFALRPVLCLSCVCRAAKANYFICQPRKLLKRSVYVAYNKRANTRPDQARHLLMSRETSQVEANRGETPLGSS